MENLFSDNFPTQFNSAIGLSVKVTEDSNCFNLSVFLTGRVEFYIDVAFLLLA